MVWYFHLSQNFPQFIVIHTVKSFGIVNKAEIDVFLELSCFSHDRADVGNLISGSSAFSKTSLNIRKFICKFPHKAESLNSSFVVSHSLPLEGSIETTPRCFPPESSLLCPPPSGPTNALSRQGEAFKVSQAQEVK